MPAPTIEPIPMNAAPRIVTSAPEMLARGKHHSWRTIDVHAFGVMSRGELGGRSWFTRASKARHLALHSIQGSDRRLLPPILGPTVVARVVVLLTGAVGIERDARRRPSP
jgi:hypothetical protein